MSFGLRRGRAAQRGPDRIATRCGGGSGRRPHSPCSESGSTAGCEPCFFCDRATGQTPGRPILGGESGGAASSSCFGCAIAPGFWAVLTRRSWSFCWGCSHARTHSQGPCAGPFARLLRIRILTELRREQAGLATTSGCCLADRGVEAATEMPASACASNVCLLSGGSGYRGPRGSLIRAPHPVASVQQEFGERSELDSAPTDGPRTAPHHLQPRLPRRLRHRRHRRGRPRRLRRRRPGTSRDAWVPLLPHEPLPGPARGARPPAPTTAAQERPTRARLLGRGTRDRRLLAEDGPRRVGAGSRVPLPVRRVARASQADRGPVLRPVRAGHGQGR